MDERDPRTLRLFYLAPHEAVRVTCPCGWTSEYRDRHLQRQHRVSSDTLSAPRDESQGQWHRC